jgi:hypothetical protein
MRESFIVYLFVWKMARLAWQVKMAIGMTTIIERLLPVPALLGETKRCDKGISAVPLPLTVALLPRYHLCLGQAAQ